MRTPNHTRLRVLENRMLGRISEPKSEEVTGSWRNCIIRNFIVCALQQYNYGDQIKEDDKGGVCSIFRRNQKCVQNFC
jgi:hypothetical protein